jgi:5-methylcytosine-specific restriction protein A
VDIHTFAATEGTRRLVLHLQGERDQAIVNLKKNHSVSLNCEVCTFSFGLYGSTASHYCEVHHLRPLSEVVDVTKTRIEDLAILCANFHRVIHLRNPPYTLDEVRNMLSK